MAERGRQGRMRARMMQRIKMDKELDDRREMLGVGAMTTEQVRRVGG